jgi:pimeloyl-ACP methyl ester carboxylesterase
MARRSLIALLVVALGLTACGGDDGGDRATSTTRPPSTTARTATRADAGPAEVGPDGFRPDPIHWTSCGSMQCASVRVPLDYSRPDGRTIRLFVSRVPAGGDRIGPLFVNPGGPGGSAGDFAAALPAYLPDAIHDRFDIVGVEPRGLQGSAPFTCGTDYTKLYSLDPTVEDEQDRTALIDAARTFAQHCEERAGDELAHVGTRDVARDLDAVRAAMGDAQMSYYGASYGTAIGQEYAELFPKRVRAMVLDAVLELGPSGLELAAEQAAGFEVALHRFADFCARSDSRCETKDVLAAVEEVQARSEQGRGIPAPDADRPAGPGEVDLGLADALYSRSEWSRLDHAIADARRGDGSALVGLTDEYLQAGSFDVYFAVNCLDYTWPSGDPDAVLAAAKAAGRESPHFGEALVSDYLRCVDWPVPPDPLTAVTATGAPPILVVSTTGDPATPYEGGVKVAQTLESGVLLTNEGDGHGAVTGGNRCVTTKFQRYLVDLDVPPDGSRCP